MKSFDMHFHQDRDGQVRVSFTLPSGERTKPALMTSTEVRALEWLVGWTSEDAWHEIGLRDVGEPELRLTLHKGGG